MLDISKTVFLTMQFIGFEDFNVQESAATNCQRGQDFPLSTVGRRMTML